MLKLEKKSEEQSSSPMKTKVLLGHRRPAEPPTPQRDRDTSSRVRPDPEALPVGSAAQERRPQMGWPGQNNVQGGRSRGKRWEYSLASALGHVSQHRRSCARSACWLLSGAWRRCDHRYIVSLSPLQIATPGASANSFRCGAAFA